MECRFEGVSESFKNVPQALHELLIMVGDVLQAPSHIKMNNGALFATVVIPENSGNIVSRFTERW